MVRGMQGPVLWRCTAPLCGTPWDRASVPPLGLMPAQGRCSRWLLLLDTLPVQSAGGECAADLALLLNLYSTLVRHALGLLASLHWGLTLPQGRCGRWLLIFRAGCRWRGQRWSVEQECGEGSACKKITLDGMDVQQDYCLRFFYRGLCAG